jgi:hypothetical protein
VRANPIKGPYLVIIVMGEYPEAHGYAPLRAYAQPIYSGTRFMPVESDFERSVLRAILGSRHEFARRSLDIAFEKPVFDRLTPLGPCRPDFLIEARSRSTGEIRQLIVEAMGGPSADYLAQKAIGHRNLEQIAPVLVITPGDVDARRVGWLLSDALI